MRIVFGLLLTLLLAGQALADGLTLTSTDLREGGQVAQAQILSGFGCTGGNVSPQLAWTGAPAGTKSFALTMYDPDAPTGSGWWHWVVFNIPAAARELPRGAGSGGAVLPAGAVQSRTDFGKPGYGGPCPPPGKPHRYVLTLFALDVERLDLAPDSPAAMVGFNLGAHTLARTSITTVYGR
ncbi:MAG: kinase inhibitor [Desulfovibrio sp.]|jgi:hypothetical protein|nr:kinase inhibitor [Desulfovibrio sp.]